MTRRTTPPFRADHVGSLLRPPALHAARAGFAAGTITADQLRRAEDDAIRDAVRMQEETGLQSATDGEFRRAEWHTDFIKRLGGLREAQAANTVPAADAFFLEYDDDRSGTFEPLRFVPPGKLVVLGLVTTKTPALESADDLKRRVEQAARYLDGDRLCLSPQCGFASTVEGNALTPDQQRAKLDLVVTTATQIWG
jgi:methionine synthase II (cobalamin-independent)